MILAQEKVLMSQCDIIHLLWIPLEMPIVTFDGTVNNKVCSNKLIKLTRYVPLEVRNVISAETRSFLLLTGLSLTGWIPLEAAIAFKRFSPNNMRRNKKYNKKAVQRFT
jgi:hypothetical protein